MKNFPHQFNDLEKLYNALAIVRDMQQNYILLTDESFGTRLTKAGIYTYRDKSLSIDEYLESEANKPVANRGYLTVARDIRRLFELLEFIVLAVNKKITLLTQSLELLSTESEELRNILWKNAFFNLGLEGSDGEISHPYRILIKLIREFPGIATRNLLLALEVENDSDEEYERISDLLLLDYAEIIKEIGTTESMARNAVKILPSIAVHVGDIVRTDNKAYALTIEIVTEDEISSIESIERYRDRTDYRETTVENIAVAPNLSEVSHANIDLTSAIKIRQKRLVEHQEIVRKLAVLNDNQGYNIYEGKFDCLSTKNGNALLYEVKTLVQSFSDEEKQAIKGVGQIKYYNFSIVQRQMNIENVSDYIVFSRKPSEVIISFCKSNDIEVLWCNRDDFFYENESGQDAQFIPD